MTEKQTDAREIALEIVTDILENGNYSHTVLGGALKQYRHLGKQDRALITRICEGTVERLITLDFILNCYSTLKVNRMKPFIRNLLRMSVYQIKYMDQVPDSAVCNEAVKLAKKRGFKNLSGFVNGVLRNAARQKGNLPYPKEEQEPVRYLSIAYSVPEWLIGNLLDQYEYSVVKRMFMASLEDRKTTIRCNLNRITAEELRQQLTKSGAAVENGSYLPYALKISDYDSLSRMEAFQKGYFQVQDESSMLVGEVSGVREGDYVVDVCAAPGGKALHIAERMNATGKVSARDISDGKISLIRENIARLGYANIEVKIQDALLADQESIGKADIVIADLPCSGLGVIGRKPDIKYNMTREKQLGLVRLQREILKVVQQYVKQDGVLIYSTCTVNREENIENVRWFTDSYDFRPESLELYLPEGLRSSTVKEGYLQLIPGIHDTDGFFIARLRRYGQKKGN